ncbi:metal-dependent hydrolase [bacterium BMS3Abin01]|nr:metal-dependent hydrolase [bacterium BMS3Abin01]HDZ59210.1 MBL fold metallo-hydrolase [Actinomycetota bacterium]
MKIKWFGHSCFLITSASGATLLTDPYDTTAFPDTLFYTPIEAAPDVVTVSHHHADHDNTGALGGAPVIVTTAEPRQVHGFGIRGVAAWHDTEGGARRGDNMVFILSADGVTVCHLGDLGHELDSERAAAIGPVDVLLIPVGGNFTIDAATATRVWRQLDPAIAIPMHFRNDRCLFAIDGVDAFLKDKKDVDITGTSDIDLEEAGLPAGHKIIVLEPAN